MMLEWKLDPTAKNKYATLKKRSGNTASWNQSLNRAPDDDDDDDDVMKMRI